MKPLFVGQKLSMLAQKMMRNLWIAGVTGILLLFLLSLHLQYRVVEAALEGTFEWFNPHIVINLVLQVAVMVLMGIVFLLAFEKLVSKNLRVLLTRLQDICPDDEDEPFSFTPGQSNSKANSEDEIQQLAAALDDLQRKFNRAAQDLENSNEQFYILFKNFPVPMWEEDFSQVKKYLESLEKPSDITPQEFLSQHPEVVYESLSRIRVVDVNNATLAFYGVEDKAALTKNLVAVITEAEAIKSYEKALASLWRGETSFKIESVLTDARRQRKKAQVFWSIPPGYESDYSRVLVSMIDITGQKKAEEALRSSEETFRLAMETTNEGLWDWNLLSDEVYYSPAWGKILGYETSEIVPNYLFWERKIHPEDYHETMSQLKAHQEGKLPVFLSEHRLRSRERVWKWVLVRGRIVGYTLEGKPRRMLGTMVDLTEYKQMQEQMIEAAKLASLGTLAAGIAHELNSPLQIITGISERTIERFAQSEFDPQYIRINLETINRNGWRCADIVRSMLSFARPGTGEFEAHDLNHLIQDTLLLVEHQLSAWSNIQVEYKFESSLPLLLCNQNQISEILINMFSNARDAMPKGGKITIQTSYDRQAERILLSISDTGTGIPANIREKIFDPFFSTKPIGQGTGLGLSIVASIVRLHNGEIQVQDISPHGSCFVFSFPLKGISQKYLTEGDGFYTRFRKE